MRQSKRPFVPKLLSLPGNVVRCFHELREADREEWFCTSDPAGHRLGSGAGSVWLLEQCKACFSPASDFTGWLGEEKRILLHAGGQSRRLPAYAPSGKILTPVPVFRWATGQCLDQDLLSLQLPLYEEIMQKAPDTLHTLIASGDVYVRHTEALQDIPEADVVCYGLWADPSLARNHGVFVSERCRPEELDFMLQKPSLEVLRELARTHLFLMDIGIWLLSDRAVGLLRRRATSGDGSGLKFYDLYSEFGLTLGRHPRTADEELNQLRVAILPLPGGEFYHYGTSRDLLASTSAVQNLVYDQRLITQNYVKPHPSMFIQNARVDIPLQADNRNLWIENSHIASRWKIREDHLFTGIPVNDWQLDVPAGVCIDVVPVGEQGYALRPYGVNDVFKGRADSPDTLFLGCPFTAWLRSMGSAFGICGIEPETDIQSAPLFPVCNDIVRAGELLAAMIAAGSGQEVNGILWQESRRLSAEELTEQANLKRLFAQRCSFRNENWSALARNYEQSVFYHLNLAEAAKAFAGNALPTPPVLPEQASRMFRIRNHMFRAKIQQLSGVSCEDETERAFALLREGMTATVRDQKLAPQRNVAEDQIVWARSPVRIDLAGGWTDTPPYCLNEGGKVVNMAIELNGQPPIQVYIKPAKDLRILLRSIDLGATETVSTYEELQDFNKVGSPFAIPKAALVLTGFSPDFSAFPYSTLERQLAATGGGLEITLLSAIPAGSGLGTSSVLSATVLGALADFYGLDRDKNEIGYRTLILEQLLTTGGGWQDQYGGILPGVKLLETERGFRQSPGVKWLPDQLFTEPEYKACHLLYYTGITRTAKNILAEIVKNMFLNETQHLRLLDEMKLHAFRLFEAIQKGQLEETGRLVGKSWEQNQKLDAGTNPPAVEAIIRHIKDYALGYKLPGAGGGGYLYMIAKDPEAAGRIRQTLTRVHPNEKARFVEMTLSEKGLQVSRS